jgi:hypothetical protein
MKGKSRDRRYKSAGEHGSGKYSRNYSTLKCTWCDTVGHTRDHCHKREMDEEGSDVLTQVTVLQRNTDYEQ